MNKDVEILDYLDFRCEIAHRLEMDFEKDIFDLQDEANNIVNEKREILEFCKDKLVSLNRLNTKDLEKVKNLECFYIEIRDMNDYDECTYIIFDTLCSAKNYYDKFTKPKTMEDWHNSTANYFEKFCKPGDIVDRDIVDYFVNSLPPVTYREHFVQAGEPYSHRIDPEDKICKATYTTFEKGEEYWIYRGNCFKDKNINMTYYSEDREETEGLEQ